MGQSATICEIAYDPGFRAAVAKGFLTTEQAIQRGSREAYTSHLTHRYGLSTLLAGLVADNRLALYHAIQTKEKQNRLKQAQEKRTPSALLRGLRRTVAWAAAILLAAFTLHAFVGWSRFVEESREKAITAGLTGTVARQAQSASSAADEQSRPHAAMFVDTEKDTLGRVTRITGPDARSVLLAFCGQEIPGRLEPLELASTMPPRPGSWIGVYRSWAEPDALYALRIRLDGRTHRWTAGNGREPVAGMAQSGVVLGPRRIPLGQTADVRGFRTTGG